MMALMTQHINSFCFRYVLRTYPPLAHYSVPFSLSLLSVGMTARVSKLGRNKLPAQLHFNPGIEGLEGRPVHNVSAQLLLLPLPPGASDYKLLL